MIENFLKDSDKSALFIGAIITLLGVIVGWFLNFITEFIKNWIDKKRILGLLLLELKFNKNIISYNYLFNEKESKILAEKLNFDEKMKDIMSEMGMIASIKKEFGFSFKTLAYKESKKYLIHLAPSIIAEITSIYRKLFSLEKLNNPEKLYKARNIIEILNELEEIMDLVINNFYKKEKDWQKVRSLYLKKENIKI